MADDWATIDDLYVFVVLTFVKNKHLTYKRGCIDIWWVT